MTTSSYLTSSHPPVLSRLSPGQATAGVAVTLHGANLDDGLQTTVIQYNYDPLYRLNQATYSGILSGTYAYEYDAVGNRLAYNTNITVTQSITYAYNAANQLVESVELGGETTTYEWDKAGRLITTTVGANVTRIYTYSQDGNLTAALVDNLLTTFIYDGQGHRLQMSVAGEIVTYTVDYAVGSRVLLEEGGAFSDTKHYLYGLACIGELVDADEPESEWRYYHQDGNHLVRQTTNMAAAVTLAWTYSPEGAIVLGEEGPVTHLGCDGNTTYDFSTGLIFKNGRYFDPNTGIWVTLSGMVVWNGGQISGNGRNKKRKRSKRLFLLLLLFLVIITLAGCGGNTLAGTVIPNPTETCTPTNTPMPTLPPPFNTPYPTIGPPNTPTPQPTTAPSPTWTPFPTPSNTPWPTSTLAPGASSYPEAITGLAFANPFGTERFFVVNPFLSPYGEPKDLGNDQGNGHYGIDLVTESYAIESHRLPWWTDSDGESWPTPSHKGRDIYSPVFGKIHNKVGHTVTISDIQVTQNSSPIEGLYIELSHVNGSLPPETEIVPGMSLGMRFAGGDSYGTPWPHLHLSIRFNNVY